MALGLGATRAWEVVALVDHNDLKKHGERVSDQNTIFYNEKYIKRSSYISQCTEHS